MAHREHSDSISESSVHPVPGRHGGLLEEKADPNGELTLFFTSGDRECSIAVSQASAARPSRDKTKASLMVEWE